MSVGFTQEARRVHPLCSACLMSSACRLVPRSRTACDALVQRGRHRTEHGLLLSHDNWEIPWPGTAGR